MFEIFAIDAKTSITRYTLIYLLIYIYIHWKNFRDMYYNNIMINRHTNNLCFYTRNINSLVCSKSQ